MTIFKIEFIIQNRTKIVFFEIGKFSDPNSKIRILDVFKDKFLITGTIN